MLLSLSRRIQLPSKLSWPGVRLFACHDPPPPLAARDTPRGGLLIIVQDNRVLMRDLLAVANLTFMCDVVGLVHLFNFTATGSL